MTPKTRTRITTPELGANRRLTFYPAIFNTPTVVRDYAQPVGKIVSYEELVLPGAFRDTLATGGEVIANVNHKDTQTYAKRTSGELLLQEDAHGLFASCYLPNNELGDSIIRGVENGQINGGSFQFMERLANWTGQSENLKCELVKVDLIDVCVAYGEAPAYAGTEVHLRTVQDERIRDFFARLRILKLKS